MNRKSGVLMHISSLFGDYSCGSFGENAKYFIDFLSECGFSYWQVLPFNDTDQYNSPYSSNSAFSCNPYFIDLYELFKDGILCQNELESSKQLSPHLCEFDRLRYDRLTLLQKAAARSKEKTKIDTYINGNKEILNFCKFMSGKLSESQDDYEKFFDTYKFIQYTFYAQWKSIKEYANSRGIKIIGDIPFYVSASSSDIFYHRELFSVDENLKPSKVAGVPPDYFSKDGQLWGNPIYNFEQMKKDNYKWWRERINFASQFFDAIRIDHFRAIDSYYEIDADEKTAKNGKWKQGPGISFINALKSESETLKIIAEDLGDISQSVRDLIDKSKVPCMRVFQFGFDDENSSHLPHNYPENCVAYTGTHDNNTLLGFLYETDDIKRQRIFEYCNHTNSLTDANKSIIKTMLKSSASTVIFPVQDLLGFGKDTRMNTPGKADDNWGFRITKEQINSIDTAFYKHINLLYGRY